MSNKGIEHDRRRRAKSIGGNGAVTAEIGTAVLLGSQTPQPSEGKR